MITPTQQSSSHFHSRTDESSSSISVPEDTALETNDISKSQLKKQLKRQKWIESRGERRKLEREKRKMKRKMLAQERAADQKRPGATPTPTKRYTLMKDSDNKFRIVIDMDFNEYMTDSEIKKAVQQAGRIYAANRHSQDPCQLYISSLKDRIRDSFASANTGYKNWDINCSDKDYLELFKTCDSSQPNSSDFIYLTGDSEHNLPDAEMLVKDRSKIFVIGGLVDHNRHKNLCYERAVARGVSTAKLPIKEHVTLCQRHILSTFTVFEIMLKVLGSHVSWKEALLCNIPKRKIAQSSINEQDITNEKKSKTEDNDGDNSNTDEIKCFKL